jgi:hypothetical protein
MECFEPDSRPTVRFCQQAFAVAFDSGELSVCNSEVILETALRGISPALSPSVYQQFAQHYGVRTILSCKPGLNFRISVWMSFAHNPPEADSLRGTNWFSFSYRRLWKPYWQTSAIPFAF